MRRVLPCSLALALISTQAGCYRSWDIGPRELAKLSGFQAPQRTQVRSLAGEDVVFDKGTSLDFRKLGRPDIPTQSYQLIQVEGADFVGIPEAGAPAATPVRIDLTRATGPARAYRYDPGITAAAVIPPTLLGVSGLSFLLLSIAVSSSLSGL